MCGFRSRVVSGDGKNLVSLCEEVGWLIQVLALLNEYKELDAARVIKDIASALPCDDPKKTFETMIAWGRYAGLMDCNQRTKMVFVPKNEDAAPDTQL